MSLHARLLAELDRREAIARRPFDAQPPGTWHERLDVVGRSWIDDAIGDPLAEVGDPLDAEHIALHDPADALRRYARDRRVLERHYPCDPGCDTHHYGAYFAACLCCACDEKDLCEEQRDLADALGVPVEATP